MYQCGRCEQTFKDEGRLVQHLRNTVPCDWVCTDCGKRMTSRTAYLRQKEKTCQPEIVHSGDTRKPDQLEIVNSINGNNNSINNNSNVNSNNNVINIQVNNVNNNVKNIYKIEDFNLSKIKRYGIIAIENEQLDLLNLHIISLRNMFVKYIRLPEVERFSQKQLRNLLIDIVALFHSNKKTPENMNIVSTSDNTDRNQVYSGKEFVDDYVSKDIRNKRVLQLVINQIKNFSSRRELKDYGYIITFIKDVFLPYLNEVYVKDTPIDFQNYWKDNMKMLETIDYKNLPTILELNDDERLAQLERFVENDRTILMDFAKTSAKMSKYQINGIISSHSPKSINS